MSAHGHSVRADLLLDYTLLDEPCYRLRLEQESEKHWIVLHQQTVFLRADRLTCERFMLAFAEKHGAGSIDLDSIELERERAAARAVRWARSHALAPHLALAPVVRIGDGKVIA